MVWQDVGYYEILGLTREATAAELKKAYFTMVRQYPPERFPEEFKRIREAYDTLSVPETRQSYDSQDQNPTFKKYYVLADQAHGEGEYQSAIEHLEKALQVSPTNRLARNLLGLCHFELDHSEKAIAIFKKLTYEFPDSSTYFRNLGDALLQINAYKQAQEAFERSLQLNNSDIYLWIHLAYCHYKLENYQQSRFLLETGIRQCGPSNSAFMHLLILDGQTNDTENFKKDLNRFVKWAKANPELNETAAWTLVEISRLMTDEAKPEYATILLDKAKKLNPDPDFKTMAKETSKQQKLQTEMDKIQNDQAIHSWIRNLVQTTFMEEFCLPMQLKHADITRRLFLRDPTHALSSVQHIQENYPETFKNNKTFFRKLLKNPNGTPVDETKLLNDIRNLERMFGRIPEQDMLKLTLDEFAIPPMPRINIVKVGRNDPCPCGSGKKYKKCCLT